MQKMASSFQFNRREEGGILGVRNGIVSAFYYDDKGICDCDSYSPAVNELNVIIAHWAQAGIRFAGLVHSHIGGCGELSDTDKNYFCRIAQAAPFEPLYFPVVYEYEGKFCICVHKLKNSAWHREECIVL